MGCPDTGAASPLAEDKEYPQEGKELPLLAGEDIGLKVNKAVYTTAPVAGGWAGAVMSWAGA